MAYVLQALIGKNQTLKADSVPFQHARIVLLKQGMAMIPLTDELWNEIDAGNTIEGFGKLSIEIEQWAQQISNTGLVAYIEAEFFGGTGDQGALAWNNGSRTFGPTHNQQAINLALKLFGINPMGKHDEFDALGLGEHRDTHDWK
jgi:hypothetical protein